MPIGTPEKSLDKTMWDHFFGLVQRARRERMRGKQPKQSWIWDAACSIRGAKDAPKYKDYILPLIAWKEEEKLSRIVDHAELKKNDYNISPSRYIHTSDAETYRPIAEIVAELEMIEKEAETTDQALRKILKQMGI